MLLSRVSSNDMHLKYRHAIRTEGSGAIHFPAFLQQLFFKFKSSKQLTSGNETNPP